MKYKYKATRQFWEQFRALSKTQQANARAKLRVFKEDPFHPRLRTHKIHHLSDVYKRTVHAVVIEGDLRAAFFIKDDTVVSVAIGTHDIYKR